ncbi:MAG TPA: hypothetical protein EYP04_04060 [Anaerolineae bacterium]|nr:hypothetical protein [Anaerolineae bacterium]
MGGLKTTAQEKEERLVAILENLSPGLWIFVDHPGFDTPEMRALGHPGYESVAAERAGVTRALTSKRVKEVIERKKIKLIGYRDLKTDQVPQK